MSCSTSKQSQSVTFLTRLLALTLLCNATGCAVVARHYAEPCKSRAFIGANLADYISSRFDRKAPVRLAIVPYSVPANLSFANAEHPGLGTEMAWRIQSELLPTGLVPIVEVFNRQDWPAKKDEFFSGNFNALQMARDAGYDLVMVGSIQPQRSMDSFTARTKVIEVDSGTTVFYGESTVTTNRPSWEEARASVWLDKVTPNQLYIPDMLHELGRCIVRSVKSADE
ncbi:MAG: hypothetical protein EBZ48_12460 [Proteobacteria bacterium]|nr:hypothetical protein [Pseudomonadota bacterium]